MSTRKVSFNRLAIKDYREARAWCAGRSTNAAAMFIDAVDSAVKRISEAPDSLPRISGKYRRNRVEKFPYVLVFYPGTADELRIVAIAHTSRRPGYWRQME